MKRLLLLIFSSLFFFGNLHAEMKIVNAGIVFAGNQAGNNNVAVRFPHISALLKTNSAEMNQSLIERINSIKKSGYVFDTENFASSKENAISMAFVLNFERVFISKIPMHTDYMLEVFVAAEVMFFDFKTKSILASYPFMISYSKAYKTVPNEAIVRDIFGKIFGKTAFNVAGENLNIFDYFAETVSKISPRRSYALSVGIQKIDVSSEASVGIRGIGFPDDSSAKEFLANMFNSNLYKNFGVPVLPFSYDNSEIYYAMAEGYQDGDKLQNTLQLSVPKPTYKINLELMRLTPELKEQDRGIKTFAFLSNYRISLFGIENESIFSKRIAKVNTTIFTAGAEDKEAFNSELLRTLIELNQSSTKRMSTEAKYSVFKNTILKCK